MASGTSELRLAENMSDDERRTSVVRSVAGKGLKTGRTSAILGDGNSASKQIDRLFQQYQPLAYKLPWEVLEYVELLATYNPDYSQAVENIKMLSNTGHELFVDAGSDLQRKRIKDFLEEKARLIQEPHGGIDGIIEKLMDQAATFGAMCGEWVMNESLTEVVDFVDLSPKKIRFFWEENEQRYLPFQLVSPQQAKEAKEKGQEVRGQCVRLNDLTFRYYAFDAAPNSPYGTPPFLAALANIAIQRDMVHNMAQIVKKIGLLGMVDLDIERLKPLPGETDSAYSARAGAYLDEYAQVAEEMVRDGGLVHFDDLKVTMMQLGGNAAGATNIFKQNEELVMSGLKSMPSLQGRSYSTTETYAGIAYEITLRNTLKYQRAAKRMIESGYYLMANMAGFNPERIRLTFNENRALNRVNEAAAHKTEIANALMLWILGIFDQRDVAQIVGVDNPKTPMTEPPESVISIASAHGIFENPNPDFQEGTGVHASLEERTDEDEEGTEEA